MRTARGEMIWVLRLIATIAVAIFAGCATPDAEQWAIDMTPVRPVPGLQVRVSHDVGYWLTVDVANASGRMARLVWDDSSIVSSDGQASRAIRGETRKIATATNQPSIPIPSGASVKAGFISERYVGQAALTRIRPPPGKSDPRIRVVLAFDIDGQRSYFEAEGRFRKI